MQTDSSASFTYFASLSASECTTTVLIPSSRQARWIRRAISPRLAIRIFSNMDGCPEIARPIEPEQHDAGWGGMGPTHDTWRRAPAWRPALPRRRPGAFGLGMAA